jgi:cytochrome c-type biogenesis protein CcmE
VLIKTSGSTLFSTSLQASITRFTTAGEILAENATPGTEGRCAGQVGETAVETQDRGSSAG